MLDVNGRNLILGALFTNLKRKIAFNIWLPLQKRLGIYVAKRLSKLSSYPNFFEIFLPQNQISYRISHGFSSSKIEISYKPDLMSVTERALSQSTVLSNSKKILFFCPEKYGAKPSFTVDQLVDSARRVSFEVHQVDFLQKSHSLNDICSVFENSVKEIKPDIVFFNSSDSYVIPSFKNFTIKFVAAMKEKYVFSLINICGDLWRIEDHNVIENWESVCDVILHLDDFSIQSFSEKVRKKALFYPFFGLMPIPGVTENKRSEILFSGQVRDSDRRYMLNRMVKEWKNAVNFRLNFKVHYVWTDESAYSEDNYLQKLNESRFCISFSQKGVNHFLIPGRSLEAVAAGCILLQQESPEFQPLSQVLVPRKHYIPFENYSDLKSILESIEDNPEEFTHIGISGMDFFRRRYSDWGFWHLIIEGLNSNTFKFD